MILSARNDGLGSGFRLERSSPDLPSVLCIHGPQSNYSEPYRAFIVEPSDIDAQPETLNFKPHPKPPPPPPPPQILNPLAPAL